MVAIVGGLLVARFVTIDGEQEGAKRQISDLRIRLSRARGREQTARRYLHRWKVGDFFDSKVIHAIGGGERDAGALREVGDGTSLTDEQLAVVVQQIIDEFEKARPIIQALLTDQARDDFVEWEDFQLAHRAELPETEWEEVWQDAYETAFLEPDPPQHGANEIGWSSYGAAALSALRPIPLDSGILLHRLNRRTALAEDVARAEQQVEDLQDELDRLKRERKRIVRPKGLGWGLSVLGYFTVVGVMLPLWLMSRGPDRLTAHLGEVVLWAFLSGLVALLVYMVVLALRLRKSRAEDEDAVEVGEPGADI
jgi:hypothetical protein